MPLLVHREPVELKEAKDRLRQLGWSYRMAARELGVSPQWLSDVLNGWQVSQVLEARIAQLGPCPEAQMSARAKNRMRRP